MFIQYFFKIFLLLSVASIIDCGDVSILDGNLNLHFLVNIFTNWFQKLTNIIINKDKDICESGLEVVNKWYKRTFCHGTPDIGALFSTLQQLTGMLLKSHNNTNNKVNINNNTNNSDESTKEPKIDASLKSKPTCKNGYQWNRPPLYAAGFSSFPDFYSFDLIDGKIVERPEMNDIAVVATPRAVVNSAGDRFYVIDSATIHAFVKYPCRQNYRRIYREFQGNAAQSIRLTLDPSQQFLLVTFTNGGITVYRHQEDDAVIKTTTWKSSDANPATRLVYDFITFHPTNKSIVILADQDKKVIVIYSFDATAGSLTDTGFKAPLRPSDNPNNIILSVDGNSMYVSNYSSGKITVYTVNYDAFGMITGFDVKKEVTTIKEGESCQGSPNMIMHPNGKYLYVMHYECQFIAMFQIDPENGSLKSIGFQSSGGEKLLQMTIIADRNNLVVSDKSKKLTPFEIRADGTINPMTPTSTVLSVKVLVQPIPKI